MQLRLFTRFNSPTKCLIEISYITYNGHRAVLVTILGLSLELRITKGKDQLYKGKTNA